MARWGDWGGLEDTEIRWRGTELSLVIVFRIGCVVRLGVAT